MEFKETMIAGEEEFKPTQQEKLTPLDEQILEINNKITKAQDFIQSLESMQRAEPNERRAKDLLHARIDLAELQTQKDHLLDEKFGRYGNLPAANDSDIEKPIIEGTSDFYDSGRTDYRREKFA